MAKYILTKPHFIDNNFLEAGTQYETDDPPSLAMVGDDDEGRKKCEERDEKRRKAAEEAVSSGRMSKLSAENLGPKPGTLEDLGEPPDEDQETHRGRRPRR